VTLALAARLLRLVDDYAVDLLFYDQIERYEAFLDDPSAWDLFRYQHGPHRQGLPFLGTRLLAWATDWNARADAFHVAGWILAATALALALRRRLGGPFSPTDVAIPLLLLTPAQYGIFVHAPNASHGAAPLFFLVLFGHVLLIRQARLRYAALVALDFVLVHTGFAIFAGALLPVVLALAAHRDRRQDRPRDAAFAGSGGVLCLLWIAVFRAGYTARDGLDAVERPAAPIAYGTYVALMFSNLLGIKDPRPLAVAVGGAAAAATLAVAVAQLVRTARAPAGPGGMSSGQSSDRPGGPEDAEDRVAVARATTIFVWTAFTLLYCGATAVGRIQLGMPGAQSSRYVPLVAPAFLGLYFAICPAAGPTRSTSAVPGSPRGRAARLALGTLAVAALLHASFPMHPLEARFMRQLAQKKRSWVAAYRETGSVAAASRAARLRIDPFRDPRRSTDETFATLRERRLSFFADRRAVPRGGGDEPAR